MFYVHLKIVDIILVLFIKLKHWERNLFSYVRFVLSYPIIKYVICFDVTLNNLKDLQINK